jgi:hypothetical protein
VKSSGVHKLLPQAPGSLRAALPHRFGEFIGGDKLAAGQFCVGLGQPVHRRGIAHDLQGLLQRFQVLWSDEDGRGPAVYGDRHPLVMVVDAANELGEVRLNVAQRKQLPSLPDAGARSGKG